MIPKEAGVSYPAQTTYTSIKTGQTTTVSNYPTPLPSKPVPIDTYSGPSMQTATPEEQNRLDATVEAILGAPEGTQLVSVEKDYTQTPTQKGIETSGTPVYVAQYAVTEEPKGLGEQIAAFNPVQWGADFAEQITGKQMKDKQGFVSNLTGVLGSGVPGVKGTPTQFLGGFVSAFESPVYAVGGLAGVKGLPKPPTLTGGLIGSGITSLMGGKLTATEELRYVHENPAYGAGSLAGDIGMSLLLGKAFGKGSELIRGKKVTKLAAATEKGSMVTTKEGVIAERTTTLLTKTERVPRKFANYLDDMARFTEPTRVDLAGTEKLIVKSPGALDVGSKAILSSRKAAPFVEAVKYSSSHQPSLLGKLGAKLGIKSIPKITVTEKLLMRPSPTTKLYETATYSERVFTGVQMFGKVDSQIYLNFVKNVPPAVAQSFYKQMGGVTVQQLSKLTGLMEVGTNVVSVGGKSSVSAFGAGAAFIKGFQPDTKTITKTFTVPTVKETTKQIPTPPFTKQQSVPRSMPQILYTPVLPKEKSFEEQIQPIYPKVTQDQPFIPFSGPTQAPKTDMVFGGGQTTIPTVSIPRTYPIPTPTQPVMGKVRLGGGQKPIEAVTPTLSRLPKVAVPTGHFNLPMMDVPKGFVWPRGSDRTSMRSNRNLFGKWSPRTHNVKSFDKMLKTFGMGKVSKSVVKLGRMETPRDFPKLFTQKKRRRKR